MLREIVDEKDILSQLSAPFMVQMNYCFQSTNLIYFAMEYCCGGDLAGLLRGVKYFEEPEVERVTFIIKNQLSGGVLHRTNRCWSKLSARPRYYSSRSKTGEYSVNGKRDGQVV